MINIRKFSTILALLLLILSNTLFSQEKVRIAKKKFVTEKAGAKEAWKSLKKGNSFYSEGKVSYRQARENYLKAYAYNDKNAELDYKIGICFLYADDKFQAINYLKKSFELNNKVTDDIQFQLARAYHMNLDFANAIKSYKLYKSTVSERKLKRNKINIDKYIAECETGISLISHPERVVVQDLGKSINSEYDDYYPVIDNKDETMYFTSRRPSKMNSKRNFLDKKFSEDIYSSKKKTKEWGTSQLLSKKLFSKKSEAAVALSPDNTKLFIYKSNNSGNIYSTYQKDSKWKSPSAFSRINSSSRETSVSFSADGKSCYFISDRNDKIASGGKDIYITTLNEKGKWNKPLNLGKTINTSSNEEGVYISRDGKTLYFSSNGHPSMGGYDIFKSELTESGSWSSPKNVGYPINTPDDDLYFSMLDNNKLAYLSSNREQSIGGIDIYRVIYLGAEKELAIVTDNSPLAFEISDKRSLLVTKPQALTVDSSIILTGKILDSESKLGIMAKMQFIDSEKSLQVATLLSDSTGTYKVKLPQKKIYGIEITAKGYLFFLDAVNLSKEPADYIVKDFFLNELSVGAKVVLKSIFFETGKANLKMESFQQLDNVIAFMKENPSLTLEISGHTDNVGSVASNVKLSNSRAKSVVEYMVTQGIAQNRLTYKGYGPNQPLVANTTKEGKAQNRRVEFKITGK